MYLAKERVMTAVQARPLELKEILGVRPVEWATEPVTLVIDAATIRRSQPRNQNACVVANACRKNLTLFDGLVDVAVRRSRAWLVFGPDGPEGRVVKYMLPAATARQVALFDERGEWHPGEYRLVPPNPGRLEDGAHKKKGTSRKGIKNVKARKIVRSMSLRSVDLKRNTGGYGLEVAT